MMMYREKIVAPNRFENIFNNKIIQLTGKFLLSVWSNAEEKNDPRCCEKKKWQRKEKHLFAGDTQFIRLVFFFFFHATFHTGTSGLTCHPNNLVHLTYSLSLSFSQHQTLGN